MPGFLTHWYILVETAHRSADAGSDLSSLISETPAPGDQFSGLPTPPVTSPAGPVWHTGPLPDIDYSFPGSDISAMAYIGALTPDIALHQRAHIASFFNSASASSELEAPHQVRRHYPWPLLLHTSRSGGLPLKLLELIAQVPSPALRSMALAFLLGYLTHIAADIAINPWLNVLASTFRRRDIPLMLLRPGLLFYVRLCLDTYIARTYFRRPLHSWFKQPWNHYIEPAAQDLQHPATLAAGVLDLLTTAVESSYGLTEADGTIFRQDYRAGLRHTRRYLAGQNPFFWLALNAGTYHRLRDPIAATLTSEHGSRDSTTLAHLLAFTLHLSEHLCRAAISYYSSLRNTTASTEERSQRRFILYSDLRDWNLLNGYSLDVSFNEEVTLRFLHSWIHFSSLWDADSGHPPPEPRS